jgi:hypothetical protein
MEILALEHPCPKCMAKATEPCKNEAGIAIHEVHTERWPTKKKAPREDVNQAAARVVREATEKA